MNRGEIRDLVRDLTGIESSDVVSDTLINLWINESYNEIARERDWDWLEITATGSLPAAVNDVHTITLANGTRRVISAYLVSSAGYVRELIEVPELDHVMQYDDSRYPKYDVTFAGVVSIAPEQPVGETYKIRYTRTSVDLTADNQSPVFDGQFHAALAYRAAVKVLSFVSDDTNRTDSYVREYGILMDGMVSIYENSHDDRPIQIGETGTEDRRYFPWFRPS